MIRLEDRIRLIKNKAVTVWFAEPGDSDSNKAIMRMEGVSIEGRAIVCKDGSRHNLLRLPDYAAVSKLERSKQALGLKFTIFAKTGNAKPQPASDFLGIFHHSSQKKGKAASGRR